LSAVVAAFLRLTSLARRVVAGRIGRQQIFRVVRLLIGRTVLRRFGGIAAAGRVGAISRLRLVRSGKLRILILAGGLVRAHLPVAAVIVIAAVVALMAATVIAAVIAALILALIPALILGRQIVARAGMPVTRQSRREALVHVLHVDVGNRDLATADCGRWPSFCAATTR